MSLSSVNQSALLENIAKMKVADLKRELKERNLPTTGTKSDLTSRLENFLQQQDSAKLKTIASSDDLYDEALNDDIEAELENVDDDVDDEAIKNLDASQLLNEKPPEIPASPKKRKISDSITNAHASNKKIVLNRAISASKIAETEEHEENNSANDKKNGQSTESTIENDKNDGDTGKKLIKISSLTAQERLEMRAKKFGTTTGTSAPDDDKKLARLQRFGIVDTNVSVASKNTISTDVDTKIEVLKKRAERFGGSTSSIVSKLDMQERLERRKARFGADTTAIAQK